TGASFWDYLVGAFALMLVVEGLLPFLSPPRWRAVFERATQMSDGQIRFIGLASMLAGLIMLFFFGT
ncbi:MAG TPA: DUF2065 domain-containing protein, partial [Burkholderiaceae bacterium]|nr:DUF2065 domain-containing protein [Burkholderiaceae bacterium]